MQNNETEERKNLAALEQELAVERERYLRLAADFDNHRKRIAREMDRRAASQKEALVRDLLPAVDNLERALTAKAGENLRDGVKMIHGQLLETLKRHGFEPRDDLGQPFDGRFHDGIAVGHRPEMPDLSVIEVWERGWMRGGELFRPAKVLVNKLNTLSADVVETEESQNSYPRTQMARSSETLGLKVVSR
jgi:molecular chaperone GrpE